MKLEAFSIPELEELAERIGETITTKRDQEKRELLKEMEKLAAQRGLSLDEVVGAKPTKGRAQVESSLHDGRRQGEGA